MKRTDGQNKRFYALVSKYGLTEEEKRALVLQFSDGKVESSALMNVIDMQRLIKHLEQIELDSMNKMRAKIVHLGREIGCVKRTYGKEDYTGLNRWVERNFKVESIFRLSYDELRKAVTGMERWLESEQKKAIKQLLL